MNKRTLEEIKAYTSLVTIITVNLVIILGFVKMFIGFNSNVVVAVVSALGSIVGGSFTWFGVRRQLKKQEYDKFLDSYATRMIELTRIIGLLSWYEDYLREQEPTDAWNKVVEDKEIFADIEKTIVEKIGGDAAIKIHERAYLFSKTEIDFFQRMVEGKESNIRYNLVGPELVMEDNVNTYLKAVMKTVELLEEYHEELKKSYEKISMRSLV